jgi:hypothetical protein
MVILDEHFPKSPVESRSLNSVVALDELPTSAANPNAVSSEAIGILEPGQAIGGFEMSKSTSDAGSLESLSSGMQRTKPIHCDKMKSTTKSNKNQSTHLRPKKKSSPLSQKTAVTRLVIHRGLWSCAAFHASSPWEEAVAARLVCRVSLP